MLKPKMSAINIKIRDSVKEEFKTVSKMHGTTMQSLLSMLIEFCNSNPERLDIRMGNAITIKEGE